MINSDAVDCADVVCSWLEKLSQLFPDWAKSMSMLKSFFADVTKITLFLMKMKFFGNNMMSIRFGHRTKQLISLRGTDPQERVPLEECSSPLLKF